jgi:hypothetical protein
VLYFKVFKKDPYGLLFQDCRHPVLTLLLSSFKKQAPAFQSFLKRALGARFKMEETEKKGILRETSPCGCGNKNLQCALVIWFLVV